MRTIRGDPILMTVERTTVMLITVPESKLCSFSVLNVTAVSLLCYSRTNGFHTLLSQEGEMTTQLPEIERRSTGQNHRDSWRYMMIIRRGDHLLLMIEVTTMILIMVQKSKFCCFTGTKCVSCNLSF
jgi:hypothetical protein